MMRNINKIITFLVCYTTAVVSQPLSDEIMNFGSNPGNLSLFYYAPKNAKPGSPMVAVLHGCSQGAAAVAELTGWNKLADEYGFYVMYPQQHFPNNPSHCFNWFKKNEIEKGNGECESIKQMVDYMVKKFAIDQQKIFITGLSAGAAMSVVMIATQPQMFKAAAIFAGGPYKPGSNIFTSSGTMIWGVNKTPEEWKELVWRENPAFKGKYPKVIVYHGNKDPVVNIRNAKELIEQWTCLHKTDTVPSYTDSLYLGKRDIVRLAYNDKDHNESVVFYAINEMGHAIPVDPGNCKNQGGKSGIFATIKNYYSTFYTACDFGLIPDWEISGTKIVSSGQKGISFSVEPKKDSNFEWKLPEGCEIIQGKNSNSITVNWGNKEGIVFLTETDVNGCKNYHSPLRVKLKEP